MKPYHILKVVTGIVLGGKKRVAHNSFWRLGRTNPEYSTLYRHSAVRIRIAVCRATIGAPAERNARIFTFLLDVTPIIPLSDAALVPQERNAIPRAYACQRKRLLRLTPICYRRLCQCAKAHNNNIPIRLRSKDLAFGNGDGGLAHIAGGVIGLGFEDIIAVGNGGIVSPK